MDVDHGGPGDEGNLMSLADLDYINLVGWPLTPEQQQMAADVQAEVDRLIGSRPRQAWTAAGVMLTPGGTRSWTGVDVVVKSDDHDDYELSLGFHSSGSTLWVGAMVWVGCYCATEHANDVAAEVSLPATDGAAFIEALRRSAERFAAWMDEAAPAEEWRVRAGLPERSESGRRGPQY
jgi:hypothetical protein